MYTYRSGARATSTRSFIIPVTVFYQNILPHKSHTKIFIKFIVFRPFLSLSDVIAPLNIIFGIGCFPSAWYIQKERAIALLSCPRDHPRGYRPSSRIDTIAKKFFKKCLMKQNVQLPQYCLSWQMDNNFFFFNFEYMQRGGWMCISGVFISVSVASQLSRQTKWKHQLTLIPLWKTLNRYPRFCTYAYYMRFSLALNLCNVATDQSLVFFFFTFLLLVMIHLSPLIQHSTQFLFD